MNRQQDNQFDGAKFAKRLATSPGVYIMRAADGTDLYIGKAKNLRKRVSSYFDARPKETRIMRMVAQIVAIEVSLTRTEAEALLLENEWIKAKQPRYNILLRDDKSYPYIHISAQQEFPRISFYRGSKAGAGEYFGPYPSAASVRQSINLIQKVFRIRNCEDSYFKHRSRPCLQYQIKRCTAPCVGYIGSREYQEDVTAAQLFLRGRNDQVIARLNQRMELAAQEQAYETAALYRDQIMLLRQMQAQQFVSDSKGDIDIIAMALNATGAACVQVETIRGGRNLGQRSFFPKNVDPQDPAAAMQAFLGQYYQNRPPAELLVASPAPTEPTLIQQVLTHQRGRKVSLVSRPRGERRSWLKLVHTNAVNALQLRLASAAGYQKQLQALQELLDIAEPIQRLECFDISHTAGDQTVGACVVFDDAGPVKSQYRRFNVKGITPGDDFAALFQVLQRRYQRVVNGTVRQPDVLIIDGGKGQLKQALDVLNELQLQDIVVLGLAKGPERREGYEEWVLPNPPYSLRPGPDSPASHLVQQIRDEAHRFAITGHRLRRQKKTLSSGLESLPGIGAKRRQALLKYFGGMQGVRKAGVEELSQVPGISRRLAETIYAALH